MKINFGSEAELIPAVIQHSETRQVLMVGFMNEEAYRLTIQTGRVTFFSRSRGKLWTKGETSGNHLIVKEILGDCDADTLLIKATPLGPTCHKGTDTCFGEQLDDKINFLSGLSKRISLRKSEMPEESYTADLFRSGLDRIAQKVGEEAIEVVISAKNEAVDPFVGEAADLLFHLMVLLEAKGSSLEAVIEGLAVRAER
jgi:phosphoribosyl-ATP pyrophosphohydrolase/phosphoribosyl-AMP cyclohydrolase